MITYTEKGPGLHDAIRNAGHWIKQENGFWLSDNDTAVQSIIDGYSLVDVQTYVNNQVLVLAKKKFDAAIAGISSGEMSGWPILRQEANAYNASKNTADCPSIAQEANDRGITVDALVAKIVANSNYFNNLRASISGTSGKHRDAIKALMTIDAVLAYDYTLGW